MLQCNGNPVISGGCATGAGFTQYDEPVCVDAFNQVVPCIFEDPANIAGWACGGSAIGEGFFVEATALCCGTRPAGTSCGTAIPAVTGTNPFDNSLSQQSFGLGGCIDGDQVVFNAEWFVWTATDTGTFEVSTCGNFLQDTVVAVLTGPSCPELDLFGPTCADGGDCGAGYQDINSVVYFDAVRGETYYILVGSWDPYVPVSGDFTITQVARRSASSTPPAKRTKAPQDKCPTCPKFPTGSSSKSPAKKPSFNLPHKRPATKPTSAKKIAPANKPVSKP